MGDKESYLSNREDDLYLRIAQGDERAFQQAHDSYKDRLFYYCRRFQLEWYEVQDIVADAFMALWKGRSQLQSNEHMKNFLYFAVRNHGLRALKAKKRQNDYSAQQQPEQAIDATFFSQGIVEAEMLQLLNEGIMSLAPEYRHVFELSYYQEKSPQEIAQILAANPATIRSQKRRAIEMLRNWVQKRIYPIIIVLLFLSHETTALKKILFFLARKV